MPNFTGLREAINQYILLIKKLTHILNKEQQKPLNDIIVKHLEEAHYIDDNYQNIVNKIREDFRVDLITRLINQLNGELFEVKSDLTIHQNYSKLWIHFKNRKDVLFSYCVEPFSAKGNDNGAMFVGLYGHKRALCNTIPDANILNDVWQHHHKLKTTTGNNLHLNSQNLLRILYDSKSDDYKKLATHIVEQIITFIKDTNQYILPIDDNAPVEKLKKEVF